jgi:hypothetical protein
MQQSRNGLHSINCMLRAEQHRENVFDVKIDFPSVFVERHLACVMIVIVTGDLSACISKVREGSQEWEEIVELNALQTKHIETRIGTSRIELVIEGERLVVLTIQSKILNIIWLVQV